MRSACASLAMTLLLPAAGLAAPDLDSMREVGRFRVYRDFDKPERFYLAPGDLEIATDENGRPKVHFLQLRYTGTALYGDAGESGSHSTLSMGVRLDQPSSEEMKFLAKSARSLANLGRVELRPLPVTAFEALLAYAPISDGPAEVSVVEDGYFESEEDADARTDQRSFWRERSFTLPMNAATSTLFWDLLQRGELAVSINYAFFSRGVSSSELAQVDVQATQDRVARELLQDLRDSGMPIAPDRPAGIAERLLRRLHAKVTGTEALLEAEDSAEGPPLVSRAIHSGATTVRVDAERWPDLFQRVDFNEELPPGYATVKVYCYDFANERRPDLFYKKVEIEAVGVGGRPIPLSAKFLSSQRDLYARTLRFPVAVHVDKPFRYRVTSAARSGEMETGPWIERKVWGGILDITSALDEGPGNELEVEG